jgi:hypothetical protein
VCGAIKWLTGALRPTAASTLGALVAATSSAPAGSGPARAPAASNSCDARACLRLMAWQLAEGCASCSAAGPAREGRAFIVPSASLGAWTAQGACLSTHGVLRRAGASPEACSGAPRPIAATHAARRLGRTTHELKALGPAWLHAASLAWRCILAVAAASNAGRRTRKLDLPRLTPFPHLHAPPSHTVLRSLPLQPMHPRIALTALHL